MEEKSSFLHGTLEATIFHATPESPSLSCNCVCVGGEKPTYVKIKIGKTRVAETSHECNRVWNQTFRILCAHPAEVTITLTPGTRLSNLGKIRIPAHVLLKEGDDSKTHDALSSLPLLTKKGKLNTKIKLQFNLRFRRVESELDWARGFVGLVDGVTFPQRPSCSVMLYQDAHHGRRFQNLPMSLGTGQLYRPRRLWEDVFKAIDGAKYLIYIAGWSLNPKMVLVRDLETEIPEARGVELGELLKRKAEEGVAVRIMIWDDETSLHFIKNQGVMRTHDEEAFNYFKHTKVVCRLCPRLHHNFPTLFAHHQKTITVDASVELFDVHREDDSRQIVSFIGGVDLCDGRYDTEDHSLFRTLNSESHAHDFYQINFAGAGLHKGGPREPWHDAHACIMGEAARDVLANFEHRWAKQCDPSLLIPIHQDNIQHRSGNWNVQVLRSIDRVSAVALPNNISSAEHSIHDAYVQAIRRAKRFIYIENQYFIGGCDLWDKDQHSGCTNLIPVEIALKVTSKIRAKERFSVYVVMPMWAEGIPESEPVQDILHWTRLTKAMMYRLIGQAIRESGVSGHPTDYLNFFCLANREEKGWGEYAPPASPPHATHYWRAQKNRRFMIYVHSKLMIVDDEYIVIGSANVNQRSMDGKRDTEIAIGCYQPKYVGEEESREGDIHKYRMSLWYEHTGRMEDAFVEPQSIDCVRSLRSIGREMWDVYSGEAVVDMRGVHLVNYPVVISQDGIIEDLAEGGGTFPDTNTLIKGRRSKLLPPVCTT